MTAEKIVYYIQKVLRYSLYGLIFCVPIVFTDKTSELFELNKMWVTFGLTLLIGTCWSINMIIQKQFRIQRTPLDIPILLFLLSQIISTFISWDRHVSLWGYYSRFNGGLYSLITYIFLYYAVVSNFQKRHIRNILHVSLFSGLYVALWGLPSHFGYDPTCLLFRGSLDVSCWTNAFQPKVRIFSTLGQPDWLAAYLTILIPVALAFGIEYARKKKYIACLAYNALILLFYLDLLYTRARSGFLAIIAGMLIFTIFSIWQQRQIIFPLAKEKMQPLLVKNWYFLLTLGSLFLITFFIGQPIAQLDKFTFAGIQQALKAKPKIVVQATTAQAPGELGGTDSGKIRLLVWQGAIDAWKQYPFFGTGVETFAFAYYKYRPVAHNLTSEWEYLYNKAHNEYLNYLTTTGIFGLGTYLSIIVGVGLLLWKKRKSLSLLSFGMIAGYVTILVTNFFGFSVVIINVYFFLIPGFLCIYEELLTKQSSLVFPAMPSLHDRKFKTFQVIGIGMVAIIFYFLLTVLIRYWYADEAYAIGLANDKAGYYTESYTNLQKAATLRPSEPTFQDELSVDTAILASALAADKDASNAAQFAHQATAISDAIVTSYPNDVTFWKTRVRVFYILSQVDTKYLKLALAAMQQAYILAPTDAKVVYNLGLLYGQTGQSQLAITTLQKAIQLKPDYRDAYYALGLYYRQVAIDKNKTIINAKAEQKAVVLMQYILTHFSVKDQQALDALKSWGESE